MSHHTQKDFQWVLQSAEWKLKAEAKRREKKVKIAMVQEGGRGKKLKNTSINGFDNVKTMDF